MEMSIMARKEYLKTLQENYRQADKEGKTAILDEYIRNTHHNRKYIIGQLNRHDLLVPPKPHKRKVAYGNDVVGPLKMLWDIFDCPCGQRLKPTVTSELDRLIDDFHELKIAQGVREKLLRMGSATMDRKLKQFKRTGKGFTTTKPGSLLKTRIPIRLTEWDTSKIGYMEMDLVSHCGGNASGDFANSLSMIDIASGWWEGESFMGKSQRATFQGLTNIRDQLPFKFRGLDSDNGSEFINNHLMKFCIDEHLEFTRSRPGKKNDNAYVEQKNWTHVRKLLGYLRFDTPDEIAIINDLYRHEFRIYKNFFQPTFKLFKKERVGSQRKRKYEKQLKTPYLRLMQSKQTSPEVKAQLQLVYEQSNPAQLKRDIDRKLIKLHQTYLNKMHARSLSISQRKEVSMVRL